MIRYLHISHLTFGCFLVFALVGGLSDLVGIVSKHRHDSGSTRSMLQYHERMVELGSGEGISILSFYTYFFATGRLLFDLF